LLVCLPDVAPPTGSVKREGHGGRDYSREERIVRPTDPS
jgi:hypothetical protein